jgi:hypothetical protein
MSIEIGILEEWSTITINSKFRVDMSFEDFGIIEDICEALNKKHQINLEPFSSEKLSGKVLNEFIELLIEKKEIMEKKYRVDIEKINLVKEIIRVSENAQSTGKELSVLGE